MIPAHLYCTPLVLALMLPVATAQDARQEPTYEEAASRAVVLKRCESVDLEAIFVALETWPDLARPLIDVAAHPDDPALHNELGNRFVRRALYQAAERSYQCALRLDGEYPAAWNNLGILYLGQQRYGQAQAALRKATRLRPNYALAYYNLGVALDQTGSYDEALEAYGRAVTLDPRLAALRFNPQVATNQHQVPIFLGRLQEQHAVLGGALDDAPPPR
jgi:tetratricopeptide (TPR) repeat protein